MESGVVAIIAGCSAVGLAIVITSVIWLIYSYWLPGRERRQQTYADMLSSVQGDIDVDFKPQVSPSVGSQPEHLSQIGVQQLEADTLDPDVLENGLHADKSSSDEYTTTPHSSTRPSFVLRVSSYD